MPECGIGDSCDGRQECNSGDVIPCIADNHFGSVDDLCDGNPDGYDTGGCDTGGGYDIGGS